MDKSLVVCLLTSGADKKDMVIFQENMMPVASSVHQIPKAGLFVLFAILSNILLFPIPHDSTQPIRIYRCANWYNPKQGCLMFPWWYHAHQTRTPCSPRHFLQRPAFSPSKRLNSTRHPLWPSHPGGAHPLSDCVWWCICKPTVLEKLQSKHQVSQGFKLPNEKWSYSTPNCRREQLSDWSTLRPPFLSSSSAPSLSSTLIGSLWIQKYIAKNNNKYPPIPSFLRK